MAATEAASGEPADGPHARDSDSGRGRTSSSSASCSLEELSEHQCDEHFEDATDELQVACADSATCRLADERRGSQDEEDQSKTGDQLGALLDETTVILRMALNNQFVKALNICSRRADRELYASLANATLSFLRAALTLEQADLEAAVSAINLSFEVSQAARRKTSTASMMIRLLYRPNYDSYTDEQLHAELVNAESLLLHALISFLSDQSIICLVKGAFRIRACYQRYKECQVMMETRASWQSETARRHFESGVRMGHGIFNLLMSYLPRRVLRLLEYVGFSGNRSVGVEELERSVALDDGLRSVFSALVILTYHSYIENLFGLGHYDANKVAALNESLLAHYPNSAFFLLFSGRYHQMEGDLERALVDFERCIAAQDDWKQFHSICHWEMMWCYAVQMDWLKAAHYSDLLRKNSKWSAASYTYQYATFLYAQLVEEERAGSLQEQDKLERMREINEIMATVPELRIRYAGKTIPAEKFAITRAIKFGQRKERRLSLAALEFLYIWNIFVTMRNQPRQVERLLERIDREMEHVKMQLDRAKLHLGTGELSTEPEAADEAQEEPEWIDELCLVLLLRGMCFKHLDRLEEAEASFMEVIKLEPRIVEDTFLVPHTAMELSLLNISLKKYDEAKRWVKLARNNYTGYLLETMVHFRLHAASRQIRAEQRESELANSSSESQEESTNSTKKEKLIEEELRQRCQISPAS